MVSTFLSEMTIDEHGNKRPMTKRRDMEVVKAVNGKEKYVFIE